MNLLSPRPIFHRRAESNVYRMFLWAILILGGIWLIVQMQRGEVKSPFAPLPTPTRTSTSYALEGEAYFTAGNLNAAIEAYAAATRVDPKNAEAWANMARIQTYSSALLTTDAERKARLSEALQSANQAVALAPEDSLVHAIRAFALDWNANPALVGERQAQAYLTEAEQEAVRALQLDNTNVLALAFYAEILVDQQKWTEAEHYIRQAVERDPSKMDIHRVYAYVLESLQQYNLAIEEYDKAIRLAPNLTFLHLRAGANYRALGFRSPNPETQKQLFDKSLEYFAAAARINEQLQIRDPLPYLSIAKTYSQEGEFFIAARNVQKALEFQPDNPDIYGQLGIIYFKSRNYEGSIPALKCAIRGCTPEESCEGRGGCGRNDTPAQVSGLPLSANTLVYYYTYGSVLAALSRPKDNKCPEARQVFDEIRAAGYAADPTVAAILQAGELICQSLSEGGPSGTVLGPTPTPLPTYTPAP